MSDVLDIQSHCDSELDESDNFTQALKQTTKRRKGRGFNLVCDSSPENIEKFDNLLNCGGEKQELYLHPKTSAEGWVIFVTNLHEEATEEDVRQLFSDYGDIKNLALNLDRRTGFSKGYAIIEFPTYNQALQAVEQLDETELLGRTIRVNWCFVKGPLLIKRSHKHRQW